MKPRHLFITLSGICGMLVLRCVNPFGGGGTETGSPGMTACAFSVYNEIESPQNWSPESYLPAGGMELDPNRSALLPAVKNRSAVPAGVNLVILRHRTDTLITVDTLGIDRTLPRLSAEGSPRIELRLNNAPVRNARAIVTALNDTGWFFYRTDTLLVPRVDSFFVRQTQTQAAPVALQLDTIAGLKSVRYAGVSFAHRVTVDSTGATTVVTADFFRVTPPLPAGSAVSPLRRTNEYVRLVGNAWQFGYCTSESYRAPATEPGIGALVSHLRASYTHPRGTATALSVVFDAGSDRRFATIRDNRIVQLDRERQRSGRTLERISFRNRYARSSGDSIELLRDAHQDTGLVKDIAIRYSFLPGDPAPDHRDLRIERIHKALSFRDPIVQSIDLLIVFDTSGNASPYYDNARVTAKMYYGKGRFGRFEGTLRARDNRLVGIYVENEKETAVDYVRATSTLLWGSN